MDQNTYTAAVPQQPCPVCSAPATERSWQRFLSSTYTHIISEKHHIQGSVVTPLVCSQCGFVQLFVNPEDFRKKPS